MVETFENKYDEPQDENTRWSNFFRDLKKSIRVMLPCEIVSIASDYKTVNVKILDKHYTIPYQLAVRLKNMKSQKSKEKLQITIMEKYKPIISI